MSINVFEPRMHFVQYIYQYCLEFLISAESELNIQFLILSMAIQCSFFSKITKSSHIRIYWMRKCESKMGAPKTEKTNSLNSWPLALQICNPSSYPWHPNFSLFCKMTKSVYKRTYWIRKWKRKVAAPKTEKTNSLIPWPLAFQICNPWSYPKQLNFPFFPKSRKVSIITHIE